jgi:bacterioferritin
MCENWGFERLYHRFRELSFEEMKDTEKLIKHIIYLEGRPNMQTGPIRVGGTVQEQLEAGLELELNAVRTLAEAIAHCTQVGDFTTRNLLEEMVREEEEHVNWFETQLEAIRQVGLENYLTQQLYRAE